MPKRVKVDYRRAGVRVPPPARPAQMRWYARVGLIALTVLLLSLSFAPFAQFYLAWVGLVPWLLLVRSAQSQRAAFLWSWAAGVVFFVANMWWLAYVTGPGMIALMVVLGLYWAAAAVVIRGAGVLEEKWLSGGVAGWWADDNPRTSPTPPPHHSATPPLLTTLLIPTVWVSLEWLRGNWPLNGLPWLFLGHGQTPVLAMCQIADVVGVYGISFWVVAVNALVALFVLERFKTRRLLPAAAVVAAMLVLVLGYGAWRMSQTDQLTPGPRVMVVQSNFPQSNTGEKGASQAELVEYHLDRTEAALHGEQGQGVDLVVWSETMMPFVNRSAREALRGSPHGDFLEQVHALLVDLTRSHGVALLTGAIYADQWTLRNGEPFASDRRNTAFFYDRRGNFAEDASGRYDKVHIVPFGEYLPFKNSFPLLHALFQTLSPYPEEYFLTPGDEAAMTVFLLTPGGQGTGHGPTTAAPAPAPATSVAAPPAPSWRFVTPICFEDIDPLLVSRMFRDKPQRGFAAKSADFIVNITNDGWFRFNQMPQHLQAARFRSIENRAPTARSVNTGISGFIDSFGRVYGLVPAGTEGVSVQRLQLDPRMTLYTRWGDVFALVCALATCALAVVSFVRWWVLRRRVRSV